MRVLLFTCAIATLATSAEFTIRGSVTNELGAVVTGAHVRLASKPGITAVTDASGQYTWNSSGAHARYQGVTLNGSAIRTIPTGAIVLDLPAPARVSIEQFDLRGARVWAAGETGLQAGLHSFSLLRTQSRSDLVRVRIDNTVVTMKVHAPSRHTLPHHRSVEGIFGVTGSLPQGDTLIVTHPYYERFATPIGNMSAQVNATLRYPRLGPDEYVRVLYPNGAETFRFGQDTIRVAWLQTFASRAAGNSVVSLSRNSGLSYCDVPLSSNEWNVYPRDLDAVGTKSYTLIDSTQHFVIGFFDIPVQTNVSVLCADPFRGSEMMVKVWEPYPPAGTSVQQMSDESDSLFSIIGRP